MSYCRWSSDNYNCDLYCYADCRGGYTTHIAKYRLRLWYRFFSWLTDKRFVVKKFKFRKRRFDLLQLLPHRLAYKEINLPQSGKTFNDITLERFYERIEYLIGIGYNAPDYVLKSIKDEIIGRSDNHG